MKPNRKRISRLFLRENLNNNLVDLNNRQVHYLQHVLRLRTGDSVVLFNGLGDERHALIDMLARTHGRLKITRVIEPLSESPLELTLVQAVAKTDAMDLIVQKSTELGVHTIYPVLTDFSVIKLDDSRASRRTDHWRKISQGACEQSGRHYPPTIHTPQKLSDGLANIDSETVRVTLHPGATSTLHDIAQDVGSISQLCLLTGPEGGLSEIELKQADESGFQKISLGPRLMRAETATLAACTLAQALWGDLAT